MTTGIKKALDSGNGNAIIFTALISAAIATCLPNPGDALYFYRQSKDKDRLAAGTISVKKYWINDVVGYYAYPTAYYLSVLGFVSLVGGSYKVKSKILVAMLAGGLVVGVVAKNIKRDVAKGKA